MRTAIFGLAVLALAIAGVAFATLNGETTTPSVQAARITLGVDVTTDGNSASGLGTIDNCKRVEVGNDFDIDVYITDVADFRGWELYLAFDGSLLTMTVQNFMMVTGFPLFDSVPDSSGLHYLAVGNTAPVSGSGVLARLSFQAVAPGVSIVSISHNPFGPKLSTEAGPIGDTNGDGVFDGPIIPASIAIGQDCPGTPVVTDSPQPTATLSPTPTPTPTPTPPTPTPAPTASQIIVGDADCSGSVGLPDVLAALADASNVHPGGACKGRTDTDCDGVVTANDALRLLRFLAGDIIPQPSGCAQIGSPISG